MAMTDIVERLRDFDPTRANSREAAAEIERLREQVATLQASSGYESSITQLEIERLLAALKPFAVPDKESLIDTLGHIGREEIAAARAALEPKP